jgi:hypothetical protein
MPAIGANAPVNFVYLTPFDEEAARAASSIEGFLEACEERRFLFSGQRADLNMIALTYFYLRQAGYGDILLSRRPRPGAINIMHSEHIRLQPPARDCFLVCVQGDYPSRAQAHFHLVQNRRQLGPERAVIWLWPQPGLLPRDRARGDAFRNIGYLGQVAGNLAHDASYWRSLVEPLGLTFHAPPPERWHDYRELDAVIAIRRFGSKPFPNKPPSKLVNAWFAGVPFIGGSDSAFEQVGTPGVDYLKTLSEDELVAALRSLANGAVRERLVEAGRLVSRSFTVPALVAQWVATLRGPVSARYRRWSARPRAENVRHAILSAGERGLERAKAVTRNMR